MRTIFLDVDGVLNRVGFSPARRAGLASWIEPELAAAVSRFAHELDARVVLASDWRLGRALDELRAIFEPHGITLHDVTPKLDGPRWREIAAWCAAAAVEAAEIVILDDLYDMGALAHRHVRVSPLRGFDDEAFVAGRALFDGAAPAS